MPSRGEKKFLVMKEYADIELVFTRHLHPAVCENPNPRYFKAANFDTLDGRIKIV